MFLSGCYLDDPATLRAVTAIFHGYEHLEEGPPAVFVFIGPFFRAHAQSKAPMPDSHTTQAAFHSLAAAISLFPSILVQPRPTALQHPHGPPSALHSAAPRIWCGCCCEYCSWSRRAAHGPRLRATCVQAASKMVFVPAESDAGDVGVLPQRPLLPSAAQALAASGADVTFASNPCRIHFYTKQVVVFASPCLKAFQGRSLLQQPRAPPCLCPSLPVSHAAASPAQP